MPEAPTLWTIGYEAAGFPAFLAALKEAGVQTVIDVRDLPLSRRAGFSKGILSASLAEAGIEYVHLKALGTPKEGRMAAKRKDYKTFWSIVEEKMKTPEAEFDLKRAASVAGQKRSALLCFEADPQLCHRKRVAEALAQDFGFAVKHIRLGV